jgi:hypothetical protein
MSENTLHGNIYIYIYIYMYILRKLACRAALQLSHANKDARTESTQLTSIKLCFVTFTIVKLN